MLNAIIIEDERLALQELMTNLQDVSPDVQVTATLSSVKEGIETCPIHRKQILFSAMYNWAMDCHLKFLITQTSRYRLSLLQGTTNLL